MKRLVVALLGLLLAGAAEAAVCTTVAGCATTPCAYATAGNWDCGHVPDSATTDTAVIAAGHTVILSTDGQDNDGMTIAGTFLYDEVATGRDANGYRTLTVTGDVTVQNGGTLRKRAGHRLGFNTTAAARLLSVNDGGLLDIQGTVVETTIQAFVDADADADCAGAGTVGRKFTITPAVGIGSAKKTGRVMFQSGKARGRSYEIRLVGASTFAVCTDTADATSGSDTTGGQRLTPHANRNHFCTGAGAPAACCSGANAGTCPTRPVNQHTEPAAYNNAECSAAQAPYPCCTGAGTGFCAAQLPAIGDKIAIVYDAAIFQAAGSNGYRINGGASNTPMPIFSAVNIANAGTPSAASTTGVEFQCAATSTVVHPITHVNFHDYKGPVDGWRYKGCQNLTVAWSLFHDVTTVAGQTTQGDTNATFATVAAASQPTHNTIVQDSTFYRNMGVNLHFNETGSQDATGNKGLRNLFFEDCISNGECFPLQADATPGIEIAYNVFADIYRMDAASGPGTLSIGGVAATAHHNYVVNAATGGPAISPAGFGTTTAQNQTVGFTHNYVSHSKGAAGLGGKWYSNLFRNLGIAQTLHFAGSLINPFVAYGNFIIGAEASVIGTADCTGANFCMTYGFRFFNGTGNDNAAAILLSDNAMVGLSGSGGGNQGRCVVFDGGNLWNPPDANFNATVDHLTCDSRGKSVYGISMEHDQAMGGITYTLRDIVTLHDNDLDITRCSTQAGVTETVGNQLSLLTATTTESGGVSDTGLNCTTPGTVTRTPSIGYFDRGSATRPDYNLTPGASALTAGAQPASSPIGIRAFRFNRDNLQATWPVLTFDGEQPTDIANVDNVDSDGDGVMDLHDNCDYTFNPSQYDADGDGKGNACDASP